MVLANPEIAGSAGLGRGAGGCRCAGCRSVDRCGPAAGHLLGHQPRPDQGLDQPEHLGKGRASGGAHLDGLRHRAGDLPWSQPAGLCGAGGGAGLRSGGCDDLPGADDGHLLEAHQQGRARSWGCSSGLVFTSVYIFIYKGWFFIPGTNWLPEHARPVLSSASRRCRSVPIGALLNFVVGLRRVVGDQGAAAAKCRTWSNRSACRKVRARLRPTERSAPDKRSGAAFRHVPFAGACLQTTQAGSWAWTTHSTAILAFLETVHPYDSLPRDELARVAGSFSRREFAGRRRNLPRGRTAAGHLPDQARVRSKCLTPRAIWSRCWARATASANAA